MNKSRGFTLIEAMVVIALVAILTTLAAPSFKNLIQSNTVSSSVNSFLADARFARSEAIKTNGAIVLCRSADPEASAPTCSTDSGAAGIGWASGWIIFQDLDNSGQRNGTERVLRVQSPLTSIGKVVEGTATTTSLQFAATGRLRSLPSGVTVLQLRFGGDNYDSNTQRLVCVGIGGRPRVAVKGSTSCGGV